MPVESNKNARWTETSLEKVKIPYFFVGKENIPAHKVCFCLKETPHFCLFMSHLRPYTSHMGLTARRRLGKRRQQFMVKVGRYSKVPLPHPFKLFPASNLDLQTLLGDTRTVTGWGRHKLRPGHPITASLPHCLCNSEAFRILPKVLPAPLGRLLCLLRP